MYAELPGKLSASRMSHKNRLLIRHIRVSGNRTNTSRGQFKTVYYLAHDEDRAIQRFIDVNQVVLAKLDFTRYNMLDSGLPRDLSQKIRKAMRI
jgi:hypothetical protein